MFLSIFFKSINDLNSNSVLEKLPLQELKKKIEILVVDDDAFSYLDILKNQAIKLHIKKIFLT